MDTTAVFILLALFIMVGFAVLTNSLVAIDNRVSKIWDTINKFYEINKGLIDVNNTLIALGGEVNRTSLDVCEHIKDIIALNTELIRIANDSLSSLETKHQSTKNNQVGH